MTWIETVIDLYIDANLLLLLAFLMWRVARAVLDRTQLRHDYVTQLRLTEGALAAFLISPVLALGVAYAAGALLPGYSLNVTDIVLSQYLDGRIQMEAEQFEGLLAARQSFVVTLAGLGSWVTQLGAVLLVAGVLASAVHLGQGIVRLRRVLRHSYMWRRHGAVELRLSDEVAIPFSTRGLWRRYVVLPTAMLARGEELRIAIAHEFQHLRRFDLEGEGLTALLRPVFIWNPAFHQWRRDLAQLRELACDQRLLERKKIAPAAYARCLISVCHQAMQSRVHLHAAAPNVALLTMRRRHNRRVLRQRIETIIDAKRRPVGYRALSLSVALGVALAIGLAAVAIQRPSDWSHDRLMLATIVNLDRLETRNTALLRLSGY